MLLITLFKLSCSISHCCTCDVFSLAWQRISRTIPKTANFEHVSKSFSNSKEGWRNIGNHSRYQHYFVKKKKKNTWWVAAIKLNCGVAKSATEMNLSEGGTPVNNFQRRFTWDAGLQCENDKRALCCPVCRLFALKTKWRKNILKLGKRRFLKSRGAKCAWTRQMVGENRKDLFTFPPLFGWRGIH